MLSLEQRLQQAPWATLQHAYGPAQDTPQHLLALLSDKEKTRDHALEQLWASICHQGSVYEASCAAVPFLIEILQEAPEAAQADILALLGGLAHKEWYAKRSQPTLTLNRKIGTESYHQWWSLESFLQEGGNRYHQPEWLIKAHELVGEGIPVYLKLLHSTNRDIVSATLDLLAGYREFQTELVPELMSLHTQTKDHALQSSTLECLGALLEADAPAWSLYHNYVTDQDAPALLRFTAAESLAWYQPQAISVEAVTILTNIMQTCSLQFDHEDFKGFADTYWRELAVGAFTHALRALCRLEPSIATQALSRVLTTSASGWSVLDTILVAEAMLDVAFFGGWIEERSWMYDIITPDLPGQSSLDIILQSYSNSDPAFGNALFRWKYGTGVSSQSWSEHQIYSIDYDKQEASRQQQLYSTDHLQALTTPQRLALETVLHCDALWQTSHNLLAIYGLPTEREQLRL